VAHCVERGIDLSELSLEELHGFSNAIDADVFRELTLEGSVAARDHAGGTAPAQVRKAVDAARARLE
jgi:argininosuccinate lyase